MEAPPMVNDDIVKTLTEDCARGRLDSAVVLAAALQKLAEIDENLIWKLSVDEGFIRPEDYGDQTLDKIELEIDHDSELSAQQKIIEKVLARYGDL
tara:strand:- start:122 stop:409 length:288 start_codon:yes stop_codon:yes gene_type:complete